MTSPEFGVPNMEEIAEAEYETMRQILSDHAIGHGVVFIDPGLENNALGLQYAEQLSRILCGDERLDEEFGVVYRAMHFMSLVAGSHGCNRGIYLDPDLYMNGQSDDMPERMRLIAESFMERCPTLMGQVDAFMHEIDPSGYHGYLAETVAGLVGAQIEDGLRVGAARDIIDAWDGTVPEFDNPS